jgi:uncharacterized protein YhbP (UPF0306 family)
MFKSANWVLHIEEHGRMYFLTKREAERARKEYNREYPHLVVEMYRRSSPVKG